MFWLIPSASLSTWSQLLVHLKHSTTILLIHLMHNITPLLTRLMHNITPSLTYLAHNICLYSVYSSHYKNNNTLQRSCIAKYPHHICVFVTCVCVCLHMHAHTHVYVRRREVRRWVDGLLYKQIDRNNNTGEQYVNMITFKMHPGMLHL